MIYYPPVSSTASFDIVSTIDSRLVVINMDREGVSPFIDRRSTLPMRSKLALGENNTSATVDGNGAIRLGTGQIILPQDIPPAY
jgi:hypothetical protein